MNYISPRSKLAERIYIGRNVIILGNTRIGRGTIIEDNCIIGKPSKSQIIKFKATFPDIGDIPRHDDYENAIDTPIEIGEDVLIQAGTIVYTGVKIGNAAICEDRSTLRCDTTIGDCSEIKYGTLIASYVIIGEHSRVGGFCANDVHIGNYVSSFGNLLHSYRKYGGGRRDPAPRLEDRVTVGFGAQVVGGITVHQNSYVAAGSVVTKDVPINTMVINCNEHIPMKEWKGELRLMYDESFPKPELK